MANSLCAVDGCNRSARIDLVFPSEHASITGENEHSIICEYHGLQAMEYFDQLGIHIPINMQAPKFVIGATDSKPSGWRRYLRPKVRDNTE